MTTIRQLSHDDRAEWAALWAQYNAFYGRQGATRLPDDVIDTTWRRLLDRNEPIHGLVAETSGRVAGVAHAVFHRSTILVDDTCYLQDLFVDPDHRRGGTGRALIQGVYDLASQHGIRSVYWHTHHGNSTARALYDQVATDTGFLVYRQRPEAGNSAEKSPPATDDGR